ncbi:MAG: peptidoglycan -binding protein [Rhodospirillales bacterium]
MASLARRERYQGNIWPGYVDALAALLMVIMFLLMIFVVAQFFTSQELSGSNQALDRLRGQVSELADLLALERKSNTDLRGQVSDLSTELQTSITVREDLTQQIKTIVLRAEMAEEQASKLKTELDQAFTKILTDKSKINEQITAIGALTRQIEALRALREDLEIRVKDMLARVADRDEKLITEKSISESARAQVALLNQQIRILRQQIAKIATSLDASEAAAKKQRIRIANLGKRLNAALAGKVQELARYRSEFFGRLREILGNQPGIRIVGDRFVFQSEVLFTKGSAELGPDGQAQIGRLAGTLRAISRKIPAKIEWILRVDGHTDKIPIATARFPSNWELSTARSISVVKFLIDAGIPSKNLAATGFGQFQPIDPRDDEIAYRRNRRIELKLTQR